MANKEPSRVLDWYTPEYEKERQQDWEKRKATYKTMLEKSNETKVLAHVTVDTDDYQQIMDELTAGKRSFLFDTHGDADEVVLNDGVIQEKISKRPVTDMATVLKKAKKGNMKILTVEGLMQVLRHCNSETK